LPGVIEIYHLKISLVKGSLFIQNGLLTFVKFLLFKNKLLTKERILIFRTGSIGDAICALPAIVAIRDHFTTAQVHILSNAGNSSAKLVSMQRLLNPKYYDEFIDYNGYKPKELLKLLKRNQYDLVIELPQSEVSFFSELRNMIFFRLAKIDSGWGWQVHTFFSFRQTQERWLTFPSETERLLSILRQNKITIQDTGNYPLYLSEADRYRVDELIQKYFSGFTSRNQLVALVPGAKRPQNRYPLNRFIELAGWLHSKGYRVAVVGGPEDITYGEAIAIYPEVISFCGLLTPVQSAILLSRCFLTIANDTGPMHLSYAAGTPVIGIYSSRDFPQKWFPPQGNIALRNSHVHCSLCLSEACQNNICMQGIPIEEIKDAFVAIEKTIKRT
jgi:ADP-heptose:LPS heptosyltransferase